MPPPQDSDVLLEVKSVTAMILPSTPSVPVIVMELEDGREFTLYNVPIDIVEALTKMESAGDEPTMPGPRETIYDVMIAMKEFLKELGERLEYVVVDYLDPQTYLYTAKAAFNLGGIYMFRRMVPSHAVFLATLFGKPIYVSKKLVDEQEAMHGEEE